MLAQAVDTLATSTALSADVNPSTFGDIVTFTAVVSATAGPAPTSGTVSFYDGVDVIGSSAVDASAVATLAIGSLTAGSHDITATYDGNATYAGSTSSVTTQVVEKADTTTSVSFAVNPSLFGDPVTFTASVTPNPGDGTVQFTIDGVDFGAPVPVDGSGEATSDAASDLIVGDHAIEATYSGGTNHNGSTGTLTQTVEPAASTTTLDSDTNPSVYADAVTFTATVSSGAGVPTGTVVFQSDGTTIPGCGSETLDAGVATCSTDALGAGTHAITADYSGSDSYDASSASALDQTVAQAATTTALDTDENPSVFGDGVTFTATVTGVANGEIPTGSVQFTVDGAPVGGPVALAAGAASLVVSDLDAGDHDVEATYSGSDNYEGSTDALTQTVTPAATATVVDADVNPSTYGETVTFTATVSGVDSDGTVQFSIDGVDFGSPVAIDASGEAVSDAISTLTAGDHDIAATYAGSTNYDGSTGTLTQTVFRADTTTNVTSDDNPSVYGDDVTFTATVAPEPAAGTVQFSIDGAPVGAPVAVVGGDASLVQSGLAPGAHQIDAEFLGSANFKPSTGGVAQTVDKLSSTTVVTITPTVPTAGASVTLKATITGSLSASIPSGTVQFSIDGSPTGSPVTVSGLGIATRTMTAPAAGAHTVSAVYSGDLPHLTSSGSRSVTVAAPVATPPVEKSGYWMVGLDGAVFAFGDVPYKGGTAAGDVADIEPTGSGQGYWILTHDGTVRRFGDAPNFGDALGRLRAGERAVSMSATPTNNGYWIFTDIGRAISFGAAPFLGDMSAVRLNGPVLGSISTPTGLGYYMVASDGGVFSFGDAVFHGSMGGTRLNQPVMGLVPDADNFGYWLVARDGGLFAFDAPFRGSMGSTRLNKPVIGMVGFGAGYLMVAEDGGIFNFSDKPFRGSLGSTPHWAPIVAVAAHTEP